MPDALAYMYTTLKHLLKNLKWLYSIGAKTVTVAPVRTTAITLLALISQITTLLAFLLPIKVIILLGSSKTPRFFPDFLSQIERSNLITLLAGTSICCYLIHLLSDRYSNYLSQAGADRLISRTRKFELFENQGAIATRAYSQYSNSLAAIVFLILGYVALLILYPLVALVVLAGLVVGCIVIFVRYHSNKAFADQASTKVPSYVKIATDLTFLASFLSIVAHYLYGNPPSVLFGLIALILTRQWSSRCDALVSYCSSLLSRRREVSALFFHAATASPQGGQRLLWQAVQEAKANDHFGALLRDVGLDEGPYEYSRWLETGHKQNACFLLSNGESSTSTSDLPLIKVFAKQRASYAANEATLLKAIKSPALPAPTLVGTTATEGLQCHIFNTTELRKPSRDELPAAILAYHKALSGISLSRDFLDRYHRTHPSLWTRIGEAMMARLDIVACTPEHLASLARLRERLPDIQLALQQLPLVLVNVEAKKLQTYLNANDTAVTLHWGRWSVDPLGSGWPITFYDLSASTVTLTDSAESLATPLQKLPTTHLYLATLAWEMDRQFQKSMYYDCLDVMGKLLDHHAHCEPALA